MQSMFRLPWSTESPGDKIMEKSALHKSRPLPVVEMPNFMNKIKRKRTDSPEPASAQHAHVVKKWKGAHGDVKPTVAANASAHSMNGVSLEPVKFAPVPAAPNPAYAETMDARQRAQFSRTEGSSKSKVSKSQKPAVKPETINTPSLAMEPGLTPVQQAIEAQIDMEILLKHNELRLIEQELAKCQTALEQLRRCSLIPFPGSEGLSENLSLGVGASLQPQSGYTAPQYAAPWGVTDGPYTRHYAKWLIPDAKFDSVSERALAQQAHGYFGVGEGRTTRGSFGDFGSTNRGRTSRTSTGMLKIPAFGETPTPAPKIDPLLHKRSTDGQWVRLYCATCAHSNFSNTQGFLNHCRIKHGQVFKSHDQAAIACGVAVDVNEAGTPVTATEPASTTAATPTVAFPVPITPGNVHPLAVQAIPPVQAKEIYRSSHTSDASPQIKSKPVTPTSLKHLSLPPYLHAQVVNSGFEGNFASVVETARAKVNLDVIDTSDDDLADASALPTPTTSQPLQLPRLPASGATTASSSKVPSARPGSKKGNVQGHARFPLSLPSPAKSESGHDSPDSHLDLSPHAVESNPGLVSDHDDDDDDDADDAHSQPDVIMHDDVVVEDASDVEGAHERAGSCKELHGCFEKGEASRQH
jgi:ADA HAT complex component 1